MNELIYRLSSASKKALKLIENAPVQNYMPVDEKSKKKEKCTYKVIAFVATMSAFFFLSIGTEQAFGTYLTTFSVKSELHATR